MKSTAQLIMFVIGLLTGGVFFWLALRDVNLAALIAALRSANFLYAGPFIAAIFLFFKLKAIRWATLIGPSNSVKPSALMPSMMVGFAGNNLLPMRLGEVIRIYLAGRDLSVSRSAILGTIMVERLFDVVSIVALVLLATLLIDAQFPLLQAAKELLVIGAVALFAVTLFIVYPPRWLVKFSLWAIDRLPPKIAAMIQRRAEELRDGFSILRQAAAIPRMLANSLIQWVLMTVCIFLAIAALRIEVPLMAAPLILGLLVAGVSLPAAPGFVGTIELCFVVGLGFFGIHASEALGAAFFYHALNFVFVTGVGAHYLRRYHLSWRILKTHAEKAR